MRCTSACERYMVSPSIMTSAGAPASVIRLPQSSMADIAICETLPLSGMILSRTAMVSGRSRLYQWEYPETRQQRVSRPQAMLTTTAPGCFSRYVCVRASSTMVRAMTPLCMAASLSASEKS